MHTTSKLKKPNNNSKRKLWCYIKADHDFDCLRSSVSHVRWDSLISGTDIDSSSVFFQDLVLTEVEKHISVMKSKQKARPAWIDKDVLKLVRKSKAQGKRLKNNPSAELTSSFKLRRKKTKKIL